MSSPKSVAVYTVACSSFTQPCFACASHRTPCMHCCFLPYVYCCLPYMYCCLPYMYCFLPYMHCCFLPCVLTALPADTKAGSNKLHAVHQSISQCCAMPVQVLNSISSAAQVPVVTATQKLTDFTVATFGATAQASVSLLQSLLQSIARKLIDISWCS